MLSWLNINTLSLPPFISPHFFFCGVFLWLIFWFISFLSCPFLTSSPLPPLPVCSSASPTWTATCLIFSRPSSPPGRALLPSPTPTVPGEVSFHLPSVFIGTPETKRYDCFPINKRAWLCNNNSCDCGSTLQNGARNQSWLSLLFSRWNPGVY